MLGGNLGSLLYGDVSMMDATFDNFHIAVSLVIVITTYDMHDNAIYLRYLHDSHETFI